MCYLSGCALVLWIVHGDIVRGHVCGCIIQPAVIVCITLIIVIARCERRIRFHFIAIVGVETVYITDKAYYVYYIQCGLLSGIRIV